MRWTDRCSARTALLWSSHSPRPTIIPAASTSFAHRRRDFSSEVDGPKDEVAPRKVKVALESDDVSSGSVSSTDATKADHGDGQGTEDSSSAPVQPKRRGRPPGSSKKAAAQVEEAKSSKEGQAVAAPSTDKTLFAKEAKKALRDDGLVDPNSIGFRKVLEREKQWEANPWMHMLSSPLRRCIVSQSILPADLLICFKNASIARPGSRALKAYILPDRILHTKYALTKLGQGMWVTGAREMLESFIQTRAYKRAALNAEPPARLIDMVEDQLRERVIQEIALLADRVRGNSFQQERGRLRRDVEQKEEEEITAFVDLRPDAARMLREERGEGDDEPAAGQHGRRVIFGLHRLLGCHSHVAKKDEVDDDASNDAEPESSASPALNAKAQLRLDRFGEQLKHCDPLLLPTTASLKSTDLHSVIRVHKHPLTVPFFVALYRLALFDE
ncbi:hypothetical protein V8E36_009241 [Tilletia maclaganii]